jgi:hypothetical protein
MDIAEFKFCVEGINKLKDFFRRSKKLQLVEDLEYIKLLIVTQDKEIKDLKRKLKTLRLENIKLIRSKK